MKAWLFLVPAIALKVIGSLTLNGALGVPAFYTLVVVGYVGSFFALFMLARGGMGLGVGHSIWGASGVALTAVMSLVVFCEHVTSLMAVGIVLIMGGVLLVELGSKAAQ